VSRALLHFRLTLVLGSGYQESLPDTFCDIHRGGSREDAPPAQGGCTSMRRPFRCLWLCAGAGAFLTAILPNIVLPSASHTRTALYEWV
jgi:hypothetical protein